MKKVIFILFLICGNAWAMECPEEWTASMSWNGIMTYQQCRTANALERIAGALETIVKENC